MHMSDALVSPAVGGAMWAASGLALAVSGRRAALGSAPLTGVLGAFVFAIQMVNFAIPGTGSSGHLGGGLLLAILLGPRAAFLTLASVLAVQALFFADGGLLALGCNLFNMGFIPAFIAFPLIYRPLAARARALGTVLAAAASLVLGAGAVALETRLSGISSLPFATFLAALVPIHLAIGLVEGLATVAVVAFLRRARPELLEGATGTPWRAVALVGCLALATGGGLSYAASKYPDGLEWAVNRVAGSEPRSPRTALHALSAKARAAAPLPEYGGPSRTSLAGVLGGTLTLALVALAFLGLRLGRRAAP
jgi:cobalt/nickel transport system permease protein